MTDAIATRRSLTTCLLLLAAVASPQMLHAQAAGANATQSVPTTPPARAKCAAGEYTQFNFWVGKWDVTSPDGTQKLGTNDVDALLNGCVVQEHWVGNQGGVGISMNYYDAASKTWNQLWVDGGGHPALKLQGGMRGTSMVLEGNAFNPNGKMARQRISYTPMAGGRVRQLWESSEDEGKSWQVLFDGIYVPRT